MKKLYLLFPVSVLALLAVVFFSFRNVEIFYTIEGKVVDINDQPVFNAVVALENKENQGVTYYEPTKKDGYFKLKFNAIEGKPVLLHIQKENFANCLKEIIPSTNKHYVDLEIKLEKDQAVTLQPAISTKKSVVAASIIPVNQ